MRVSAAVRPPRRSAIGALGVVLLAGIALSTCTNDPTGLGPPGLGSLALKPVLPEVRQFSGLILDHVRLIAVRPPSDTLADVTQAFSPSSTQITLTVPVLLQSPAETLTVTLQYLSGTTLLFSTTGPLVVHQGPGVAVSSDVALPPPTYSGPGSNVVSIALQPRDTTLSFGAALPFRLTALDINQSPVTQYYVSWRTSPPGGVIDGTGTLTAASLRQTFYVVATTPDSVKDSTTVTIVAPLAQLLKVSGDNQSGLPLTRPNLPLRVQVLGSDNLGVPGVSVTFSAVTGGGAPDTSSTLTDASGFAGTTFALGGAAGTETFQATVTGLAPITFTEFATSPAPVPFVWNGSTSTDWFTAGNWTPAGVPGTGDSVRIVPATNQPSLTARAVALAVHVVGSGANLRLNGRTLAVSGGLTVDTGGVLTETSAADSAVIGGNALFAGGDETGRITAGVLAVGGNFNQVNQSTALSFVATAGHKTTLNGAGAQNVDFQTASAVQSTFQNLEVNKSAGAVTLSSTAGLIQVNGNLSLVTPSVLSSAFPSLFVVGNVTTAAGSTLAVPVLGVGGTLSVSGTYSVTGNTLFTGTGQLIPVLPYSTISVQGTASLTGRTTTSGSTLVGGSGTLTLNGHTLVTGLMQTGQLGQPGTLTMTNPLDSLIAVNVLFQGGSTAGLLTNGVIVASGNFTQGSTNSTQSFSASGSHKVVLNGAAVQAVQLNSPANSHFQNLELSPTARGMNLTGNATVNGLFTSTPSGAAPVVNGTAATLSVGGINVTGLVLDAAPLVIAGGTITGFSGVTLQNMAPTAIQLTINHPGAAASFSFNNLVFSTTPTTGGAYLSANDTDGPTPNVLSIDMVTPNPATPGGFVTTTGGAVVNWPAGAAGLTWTGAVSTNWSTAGNWNPARVPNNTDDVLIPAGTPSSPALTTSGSVKTLTVNAGATLALGSINLQAIGNVFIDGSVTGTAAIQISASAQIRGNFTNLILSGPVTASGTTTLSGNLTVTGASGNFDVGGHTVTVGNLTTQGGALLTMTHAADLLTVTGSALFGGGAENGSLTAGTLLIAGDLTQNVNGQAFVASGTHRTAFNGAAQSIINFANPTTSVLQDLDISQKAGGVLLNTNLTAVGQLISLPSGAPPAITGVGRGLSVAGFNVSGLTLNNVLLTSVRGTITAFNNVTFTGYSPSATQLSVSQDGPGSPFVFDGLTFASVPSTGFYISALDLSPADGVPLTLNLTNPSPSTGAPFIQTLSGAVVNWPAAAPAPSWTGAASTDWFTAANWSPAGVPLAGDSVVIPTAANTPILTGNVSVGAVNVSGGNLTFNGHSMNVARTFATTGSGQFTMTNPADQLIVAGNVLFNGGDLSGRLTDGLLRVAGNFTQQNTTSKSSFVASGNHRVELNGTALQTVAMPDTLLSFFRHLQITNTAGVDVQHALQVTGDLDLAAGVTVNGSTPAGNFPGFNVFGNVTTGAGSSLTVERLFVAGILNVGGSYTVHFTIFQGSGQTAPATLPYQTVTIYGTVTFAPGTPAIGNDLVVGRPAAALTLAGTTTVAGNIFLDRGTLTLNGQQVQVAGSLIVDTTGTLTMTSPFDQLSVGGNASFGGGNETGLLTDGTLTLAGDFFQTGTGAKFFANGSHTVNFAGAANHIISLADPVGSRFRSLAWNDIGGILTLGSDVTVTGSFLGPDGAGTISGAGRALTVGDMSSAGITMDNARLVVDQPAAVSAFLSSLTFVNLTSSATQITIRHPGIPSGSFNISSVSFFPLTAGNTGFYIDATDTDGPTPDPLVVDVNSNDPGNGPAFTKVANGATVNWPAPLGTWTGQVNTDWFTAGNWTGNQVPTITTNVTIPAGTPFSPLLTTVASVNDLTVQTGATLDVGAAGIAVVGNLDAGGSITNSGGGALTLVGTGKTLQGNVGNLSISGTYALAGNVLGSAGTAQIVIGAAASLSLNGHRLAADVFATSTGGLLVMTNPLDSLIVANGAFFDGGDESGLLTAGVAVMNGDFNQVSTNSPNSFAASGGHKVTFTGTPQQNVGFQSPGAAGSQFRNLEVSSAGGVVLATDLLATAGVAIMLGDLKPNGHALTDQGSFVTSGTGTLTMQSANDSVLVTGAGIFGGGSTAGRLTDGVLKLGGSFSQTSGTSTQSFSASGTHKTILGGLAVRVAKFASPGTGASGSHFGGLDISLATGGLTLQSVINADGQFVSLVGAGTAPTLSGSNIFVQGSAAVDKLILDNAPFVLNENALSAEQFDNVQFVNFPTAGQTQLNLFLFGTALTPRLLTVNNLQFTPEGAGTGSLYVDLTSANSQGITVSMQGSNQSPQVGGNGPALSNPPNQTTVAGARILWP